MLLPSIPSRVVFFFHACLVSILFSGSFLNNASHFVAIKNGLRGFTDWLGLGLQLGMELAVLKSIEKHHGNKVEKCKTALLHSWLQTGTATKRQLVDALREMDEDFIANKLESSIGTLNLTF